MLMRHTRADYHTQRTEMTRLERRSAMRRARRFVCRRRFAVIDYCRHYATLLPLRHYTLLLMSPLTGMKIATSLLCFAAERYAPTYHCCRQMLLLLVYAIMLPSAMLS